MIIRLLYTGVFVLSGVFLGYFIRDIQPFVNVTSDERGAIEKVIGKGASVEALSVSDWRCVIGSNMEGFAVAIKPISKTKPLAIVTSSGSAPNERVFFSVSDTDQKQVTLTIRNDSTALEALAIVTPEDNGESNTYFDLGVDGSFDRLQKANESGGEILSSEPPVWKSIEKQ